MQIFLEKDMMTMNLFEDVVEIDDWSSNEEGFASSAAKMNRGIKNEMYRLI